MGNTPQNKTTEAERDTLLRKGGELQIDNDFKKKLGEDRTMSERKKLIERGSRVSLRKQSELLGVCRSSLYIELKGESNFNQSLMKLIDKHLWNTLVKGYYR